MIIKQDYTIIMCKYDMTLCEPFLLTLSQKEKHIARDERSRKGMYENRRRYAGVKDNVRMLLGYAHQGTQNKGKLKKIV